MDTGVVGRLNAETFPVVEKATLSERFGCYFFWSFHVKIGYILVARFVFLPVRPIGTPARDIERGGVVVDVVGVLLLV